MRRRKLDVNSLASNGAIVTLHVIHWGSSGQWNDPNNSFLKSALELVCHYSTDIWTGCPGPMNTVVQVCGQWIRLFLLFPLFPFLLLLPHWTCVRGPDFCLTSAWLSHCAHHWPPMLSHIPWDVCDRCCRNGWIQYCLWWESAPLRVGY